MIQNAEEIDEGRRWPNVFGDEIEEKIKNSRCTLCYGVYEDQRPITFVVLDTGGILWWHTRSEVGSSNCIKH